MYTREHPSPEYVEAVRLGKIFHETHKVFSGRHIFQSFPLLRELCQKYKTKSILDYGIGKAQNLTYRDIRLLNKAGDIEKQVYHSWVEALGVDEYVGYDPCVPEFEQLPNRTFEATVSTDVLEHIPVIDIEQWVVEEMFNFATQWVYLAVACYEGKKKLADGSLAHKAVMPPAFWVSVFNRVAKKHPQLYWELRIEPETSPLTHRRFSGQGGQWSEGLPWWQMFKPAQIENLTEKQQLEMLQLERAKIEPLDLREFE